eukprot:COSAG02_NODE_451_length_22060_cov_6.853513_3_plen_216_part_00
MSASPDAEDDPARGLVAASNDTPVVVDAQWDGAPTRHTRASQPETAPGGMSRDHHGRKVDRVTGLDADRRTNAYVNGHELKTLHGQSGRYAPVFRGTCGLRDQRIARAQGRCDTRRERAARNAQKELQHAQAAFQRAAGSVTGTVTREKIAKFMWEFEMTKVSDDECKLIMIYADLNGNGVLDPAEIPAAIKIWKQVQSSADLLEKHAAPLSVPG